MKEQSHFSPGPMEDPDEMRALYAMHCAAARHPGTESSYRYMKYADFRAWWSGLDPDGRQRAESQLRCDYKQVLKDSVASGMEVVKKYLKADDHNGNGRFPR